MEDMIKMITNSPQEQRKQMITNRLTMIAAQPEPLRTNSAKEMVMAISKLDEKKKAVFIEERTNIISQLPPETKGIILMTRAKVGPQLPEKINMDDMKYTLTTVKQWPEEKRNMFIVELKKAFQTANVPMPDICASALKIN